MAAIESIKAGIVFIKNNPYYYVEQVSTADSDSSYIVAYNISKNSLEAYKESGDYSVLDKKSFIRRVSSPTVLGATPLSKIVTKGKSKLTESHNEVLFEKPLFVSEVTIGTDSFSGDYDLGFEEYVKGPHYDETRVNRNSSNGSQPAVVPTGVFIGLKHVSWIREYIPIAGLSAYLSTLLDDTFGYSGIDIY